jgi:glycogen debranching enzyme
VNKKNRIIQDTGTGGAYPCSTDRIVWSVAAFEIYKATGDKAWLKQAFEIIQNTIEDNMKVAYDAGTGLVKGESSFLDWREQTYPKWMQPADIYESENLGTNAVHYQANIVLAQMAGILNNAKAAVKYNANAAKIKAGINKYLWMNDKGYYAQYLYGRNYKIQSPRAEALGEALCVLFGIASQHQAAIIANTPVTDYGISCIYPQISDLPPYHNNAVWPFVQSYWALASAKSGNEKSVLESLAAIYRPAALFLTNKENFVADNGDFAGTVINSSNMLWSLSGNLSMVHKLIFGIEFQPGKIIFHPFVPE